MINFRWQEIFFDREIRRKIQLEEEYTESLERRHEGIMYWKDKYKQLARRIREYMEWQAYFKKQVIEGHKTK